MKIAVLGAGAMGGLFASYLCRHNDVTLISRHEEQADLINKEGFTVLEKDGTKEIFHPHALVSTKDMEPQDLVILFVKSMANESVLAANRSLLGPDTYLCTLQNGSGHEEVLRKFVPEDHIILGTTQHNASTKARNITRHGGSGMTHFGGITGDAKRLQRFADCFTSCGLQADVSDRVQEMIWNKMFTNISASALTGALQVPLGYIVKDPYAWSLCCQLIGEAVDVAAALGMHFDREEKIREVRAVCENAPDGLTSIYADLKNGRKTEVDAITGSVVRAGEKTGVPTPGHSFLLKLIHAMEGRSRENS